MNCVQSIGHSQQKPSAKGGKGKLTGSEATTRSPRASCFEKPTRSVPETWGCMYNILAQSANGTRNGTRNWIPVQLRKARKKLVSSNFAKILEYKSSETCEKALFTPPSPIKATNSIVSV
jgi:hypothetical protein